MKASTITKVLIVNAVLLLVIYFDVTSLASRASYAAREGLALLQQYSPLTRVSVLSGRGASLPSPLTLDWSQALVAAMAIIDVYFAYSWRRSRVSPVA